MNKLLIAALFTAGLTSALPGAIAQTATPQTKAPQAGAAEQGQHAKRAHQLPSERVEARLAYLQTALKITEQIMPNRILKEAIVKTREEVTDGKTIAQPLARSKIFPQLMIDLLKIGEDTGDVPGALENVANTYENELTLALRVMMNLIEVRNEEPIGTPRSGKLGRQTVTSAPGAR